MGPEGFTTPVAMFIFNRPGTTQRVFDAVANLRPKRLLLVADGPRPQKPGEEELCAQTRKIVTGVDWPCEVSINFSQNNLGCQERIISGIDWVFSLVEEAIILEDDCLPDPTFFPFCAQLLERYRGDTRIGYIAGCNLSQKHVNTNASYYFSQIGGIWGWATWKAQWQRYDRELSNWPELKQYNRLSEIFDDPKTAQYWTRIFDAMHEHRGPNTWDYQWLFTCLKNNLLTAVSRTNLVTNIGYGPDATHSADPDAQCVLAAGSLDFPLSHPSSFIPLRSVDRHLQTIIQASPLRRVALKLRRLVSGWSR